MKEIDENGYTVKAIVIPETGRMISIHARAQKMDGKRVYAVYLTDVTAREAESRALYEMTNDIPAGVGICHIYPDNRIKLVFMNAALL